MDEGDHSRNESIMHNLYIGCSRRHLSVSTAAFCQSDQNDYESSKLCPPKPAFIHWCKGQAAIRWPPFSSILKQQRPLFPPRPPLKTPEGNEVMSIHCDFKKEERAKHTETRRAVATLSHVRARRECVQQRRTLRSETFAGLVLRVAGLRLGLADGQTPHQRHKHQVQDSS